MFDYIGYMRTIAEKLKEIQHCEEKPAFHRVTNLASLEELIQNENFVDGYQLIVEDVMEGNFGDTAGTLIDISTHRYYIVKQAIANDFDSIEEVKKLCKAASKKVVSRLRRDGYLDNQQQKADQIGLANLQRDSFQYFSVGPILDNFWGIETSFNNVEGAGVKFNEADWLD